MVINITEEENEKIQREVQITKLNLQVIVRSEDKNECIDKLSNLAEKLMDKYLKVGV